MENKEGPLSPGHVIRQAEGQGICRRWKGDRLPYLSRDVVCGMQIEPDTAPAVRVHIGETYYFCSGSCAREFEADPWRFLLCAAARATPDAPRGAGNGTA